MCACVHVCACVLVSVCVHVCVCTMSECVCLSFFMKSSVNVFRYTSVYIRAYARKHLHAFVWEVHFYCVRRRCHLIFASSAISIKLPLPSQCKQEIVTSNSQ